MVTKTTTNCDKCGGECVNGMVRISAVTSHWTKRRDELGEDYYQPLELCITCGQIAAEVLGMKIRDNQQPSVMQCERPAGMDQPITMAEVQR